MFTLCSAVKRIEQKRTERRCRAGYDPCRNDSGPGYAYLGHCGEDEIQGHGQGRSGGREFLISGSGRIADRISREPAVQVAESGYPQRKSPSPFGPGLCGVGGEGGGVPITAGGVHAERPPPLWVPRVPRKFEDFLKWGKKRSAPDAYRGASPTAAVSGDYLPSPTLL